MNELLTAVRDGRTRDAALLVADLDRAGRKEALAGLKLLRKEARGWDWRERTKVRHPLLVAGAGCHTGAAACAAWIGGQDLRDWSGIPHELLLKVLADREPVWLGDLSHRLAARPTATSGTDFQLVQELARIARCPLPVTASVVEAWVASVNTVRLHDRKHQTLIGVLREETDLGVLAPRLFDGIEPPSGLYWYDHGDAVGADGWPTVLATLAGEGLVERGALIDGAVNRLLRGGRPGDLRFSLAVVRALELTADEEAERVPDWIAMAADGVAPVAGHAQGVLTRLDALGRLTTSDLADVSASILFRTEKKLVRAQLVLLGKVLRRDPASVEPLLPVVAEAFGHEDMDIRERALKLTARHLTTAPASLREELAPAAAQLGPMHRELARELFGDLLDGERQAPPYEEALPPVPALRPLGAAVATVSELVEEVAALVKTGSLETTPFERALDGLIRHSRSDRTALTEALRDALAGQWWLEDQPRSQVDRWFTTSSPRGLDIVAAALLGRVSADAVKDGRARRTDTGRCAHAALDRVLYARLWEAASLVRADRRAHPVPFLLATPTWHTGALDAAELVERLRTYRDLGALPGPVDFGQALLRVNRSGEDRVAEEAALLGTAEGDRLAIWLRTAGPVAPVLPRGLDSDHPTRGDRPGRGAPGARRVLLPTAEGSVTAAEFPRAFHWLGHARHAHGNPCYHEFSARSEHWLAALPQDPDSVAAWLTPTLMHGAEGGMRGSAWFLPRLVEARDGSAEGRPAGEATHLALAYGLGARHPEDRLSAVDALLLLAAQGRLDPALLGRELAMLVDRQLLKINRLADSARTAASTGAYRTVLAVLSSVLPTLLAHEPAPRGLGEILTVAAECAERCGPVAGEPAAGLAAAAGRGGTSQLVRQAGRLLAAWGGAAGS
ncbi:DUF7825 domain-containing protein [Streptomyces flavovirens]